jgi:hypothetical protein
MLWAEGRLPDRQRPLVQRLRRRVLTLRSVELRQGGAQEGMVRAVVAFSHLKDLFLRRYGLLIFALSVQGRCAGPMSWAASDRWT